MEIKEKVDLSIREQAEIAVIDARIEQLNRELVDLCQRKNTIMMRATKYVLVPENLEERLAIMNAPSLHDFVIPHDCVMKILKTEVEKCK